MFSLYSIIHIGDKTRGSTKRNSAIMLSYITLEPKSVLLPRVGIEKYKNGIYAGNFLALVPETGEKRKREIRKKNV